jgi:hydrogenase maturation protein HypF
MGRVFDAVSSILGICSQSAYEGQAAAELESAAARYAAHCKTPPAPLPFSLRHSEGAIEADLSSCFYTLNSEWEKGVNAELLACRFHLMVSKLILAMCLKIREIHSLGSVALSGGVFQNRLLLSMTVPELKKAGFTVYMNHQVPPGDGGISLGQAYVARHLAREAR